MSFEQIRANVRNGDLIAVRGTRSGLAAITRAVTGSPYTHTAVAVRLSSREAGGEDVYVAEMDGVKGVLVPLSQYADEAFDVFECPVISRADVVVELLLELAKRVQYDYLDLIRIGLWRLWRVTLPKRDRNGLVCSAQSARIYRKAGWLAAAYRRLPSIPAPDDLVVALGAVPYATHRP